jgi:hypothetical protein
MKSPRPAVTLMPMVMCFRMSTKSGAYENGRNVM